MEQRRQRWSWAGGDGPRGEVMELGRGQRRWGGAIGQGIG